MRGSCAWMGHPGSCWRRSAAEDGVLLSLFGADVVPPVAFAVGDGLVSLLDVAEHLVVELFAEAERGQR